MRVLLTTPYDLAVPGGVNRHALELLDALTARGHEAKLAGPASQPVFAGDPRIVRLGRVWVGALNGANSRVTLDVRIGGAVRRLIAAFRPEVVHVQEPFLPTLNTFALLFAGRARRVGTFHTFSETSLGYLWAWPWCRCVNARLDVRIAVSQAARDFAARFHPAPYEVVQHGLPLPHATATRPTGPVGRPVRLLFVGRAAEPRKGFAVLLAALARLEREVPGAFALTVVGPDEPPADGLPITWRGHLDDATLSAAYAAADVCVVPSRGGESFGLVALEALAHGVPVVASRIRGYADWLDGSGTGALVSPDDDAALAAALRALADDAAWHAACAVRAREFAAHFDRERQLDRLLALYASGNSKELGSG